MPRKQLPEFRVALTLHSSSAKVLTFSTRTWFKCIGLILLISIFASACSSIAGQTDSDGDGTIGVPDFLIQTSPALPDEGSQIGSRQSIEDVLGKGIKFDHLSLEDGLSQSVVTTILQDS